MTFSKFLPLNYQPCCSTSLGRFAGRVHFWEWSLPGETFVSLLALLPRFCCISSNSSTLRVSCFLSLYLVWFLVKFWVWVWRWGRDPPICLRAIGRFHRGHIQKWSTSPQSHEWDYLKINFSTVQKCNVQSLWPWITLKLEIYKYYKLKRMLEMIERVNRDKLSYSLLW